jgi:hypothetical protein
VTEGSYCDPNAPTLISSFSGDLTDDVRVYNCGDVNDDSIGTDIQVTIFIWNIEDSNNDGVLDTLFREPCFSIQTIIDQNDACN